MRGLSVDFKFNPLLNLHRQASNACSSLCNLTTLKATTCTVSFPAHYYYHNIVWGCERLSNQTICMSLLIQHGDVFWTWFSNLEYHTTIMVSLECRIQGDCGWQFHPNWCPRALSKAPFGPDQSLRSNFRAIVSSKPSFIVPLFASIQGNNVWKTLALYPIYILLVIDQRPLSSHIMPQSPVLIRVKVLCLHYYISSSICMSDHSCHIGDEIQSTVTTLSHSLPPQKLCQMSITHQFSFVQQRVLWGAPTSGMVSTETVTQWCSETFDVVLWYFKHLWPATLSHSCTMHSLCLGFNFGFDLHSGNQSLKLQPNFHLTNFAL